MVGFFSFFKLLEYLKMADLIYVTGSQNKADFLAKFLGVPFEGIDVDLDEKQYQKMYLSLKPIDKLQEFLERS